MARIPRRKGGNPKRCSCTTRCNGGKLVGRSTYFDHGPFRTADQLEAMKTERRSIDAPELAERRAHGNWSLNTVIQVKAMTNTIMPGTICSMKKLSVFETMIEPDVSGITIQMMQRLSKKVSAMRPTRMAFMTTPVSYLNDRWIGVLEGNNFLRSHHTLNEDEILIKISGDKGHGRTVITATLLNQLEPNSAVNTDVIVVYEGDDRNLNLQLALGKIKLAQMIRTWHREGIQGKKTRVVFGGDLMFLSALTGHGGASCTYPCMLCKIKQVDLGSEELFPLRTFNEYELLQAAWAEKTRGLSKTAAQKLQAKFVNCKDKPIDLGYPGDAALFDYVILPYLHILLEVGKRHYLYLYKGIFILIDLTSTSSLSLGTLPKDAELKKMRKANPENFPGPLTRQFEEVAASGGVIEQKFWGALVGNHCNTLFKPETIKLFEDQGRQLIAAAPITTSAKTQAYEMLRQATEITEKFSRVHMAISHSQEMTQEEVELAITQIKEYIRCWTEDLGKKIFPKLHYLWHHAPPYLRTFKAGFGEIDEHGVEAVHSQAHTAMRTLFYNSAKDQGLKSLLKHLARRTKLAS